MGKEEKKKEKEIEKLKRKLNKELQLLSDPKQRHWFSMIEPDERLEAWKKGIQKQIDELDEESSDENIKNTSKSIDELIEWAKNESRKPIELVLTRTDSIIKQPFSYKI